MNLRSTVVPTWCPGCNNYLVYAGIQAGITALGKNLSNVVICYDIGCAGNMADFLATYGAHTLHGRSIPFAMGVKMANPNLTVIVVGGDGGIYGEGLNHLISAARMNIDIKVLVANNRLYSLTTGQTSPTTPKGAKTKSTPKGNLNLPINAVELMKAANPDVMTLTADSKNPLELNQQITKAFTHPGFALVDISQVCVAFGKQLES